MSQAKPIQVGDVVKLKSGGPKMTVTTVDGARVECEWFDAKSAYNVREFAATSLEHWEPVGVNVGILTT